MKTGFGKALGALALATSMGLLFQTTGANAGMLLSPDVVELGLTLRENAELGRMPSMIYAIPDEKNSQSWRICKDIDDKACTDASTLGATAHLSPCTPTSQLSCIAAVWAVDSTGKKIPGEFVKNAGVDPKYAIEEILSVDFPRSAGTGSIWKIPGVLNSAGLDTYFVATEMSGRGNKKAGTSAREAKLEFGGHIAGIMPVQEVSANVSLLTAVDGSTNPLGAFGSNGTQFLPDKTVCAATETGICYAARQFPAEYKFGMTLRLTKKLSGWFHGRLFLPNITSTDWKSGQEISIEAEPVKVPSLDFVVPNSEIPKAIRDLVFDGREWGMVGDGKSRTQLSEYLGGQKAMDLVSGFAPSYKDKATTTDSYWSFQTLIQEGNADDVYRCSARNSALSGLVTTNALTYSAGPPVYDKSTGSLNYKVSSPHFEADGKTEAMGSYDLALKSEVARCIYGFSNAPIKAEISITSQDGEKKVATTVINERNGWLYLSAKGFTFSAPVINVKLSQEAPVVVPSPTPTATKAAAKVTKITCVKGKTKKVVSGVKPFCPKGYKLSK